VSGSQCRSDEVTLSGVSLFGRVVTARTVWARDGVGVIAGLEINGEAVAADSGDTVRVDGWGSLSLGATVGRVTAPMVLRLSRGHDSLPAGTVVAVAFAAAARSDRPASTHRGHHRPKKARGTGRHRRRQPPPDFPVTPFPFLLTGGLTDAAQDNPIVSIATRYLGVRYQWGGASPSTGFDCSGLVQYVFAQLGVSLVHYAAAQWSAPDAVAVAPQRLQPGDLVFFIGSDGTRKAPGHVGIYVGDGYFIDAPHTGAKVRIDSLTNPKFARQYLGARRILGPFRDARRLGTGEPHSFSTALGLGFAIPGAFGSTDGALGSRYTRLIGTTELHGLGRDARSYGLWAAAILGGLLVLLAAGGLVARRRTPEAGPGDS
jgi:cell wall-associated NlpC family hydrolase